MSRAAWMIAAAVTLLLVAGSLELILKSERNGGGAVIAPLGYSYVEELVRQDETAEPRSEVPTRPVSWQQRSERWVRADLRDGFQIAEQGHVLSGDRRAVEGRWDFAGGRDHYTIQLDMRPPLRALPTDPTAVRELLLAAIKDQRWDLSKHDWLPGEPTPKRLEDGFAATAIGLLADADVTAAQRRALFEALKLGPDVEAAPEAKDALGRSGDAVRVSLNDPEASFTVIFDHHRAELLFRSIEHESGDRRSHTIVRAGHVDWLGYRP